LGPLHLTTPKKKKKKKKKEEEVRLSGPVPPVN
jgi:hypothetical protein